MSRVIYLQQKLTEIKYNIMEKYYKIKKEIAARAGFNEILRTAIDEDHLLLSAKDIRMIDLSTEEKINALNGEEYTEPKKK